MLAHVNVGSIVRVFGRLVLMEGALLLMPLCVCLIYGESDWMCFTAAVGIAVAVGLVAEFFTRHIQINLRLREGCILTALVWVVFSLFGMVPFMLSTHPLSFTDAMFEAVSGFTTTGGSIITDVEAQSHGILFWRALSQWVGGLGIILFMLAVLPALNKSAGISMFNAEATGISHTKLHPRIRQTAISLWGVYASLTGIAIAILWIGPMDFFDAVCQTLTAISTGGFVTHNEGLMFWDSNYVYYVMTAVMFVGGMNFLLIYGVWRGRFREMFRNDVFRTYVGIIVFVYLLCLLNAVLRGQADTLREAFIFPLFHIVAAITSSGFGVPGVESWGSFVLGITLLLMLIGACAGSTTGGMKIDRLMVLRRNITGEAKKMIFPKRTYVVTLNGNSLDTGLVSRITAFVTLYLFLIFASMLIITLTGYSFSDSLFMSTSAMACNGLGYGVTGAEGGFFYLPAGVKWLLIADMLVGRLELFTFLVLMFPAFWRR